MNTLRPITNRAADGTFALPADGWFHVAPRGEFPHPTGAVQVLDDAALASMVNRFAQAADRTRIDFDHFSYDGDKPSLAAGWIVELGNRADGLWARVRWTPRGEQALKDGDYRFLSPVWLATDVEQLGNRRVRPLRLDSAGLTNNPNLRGLAPLSNRAAAADAAAAEPQPQTHRMKNIATRLGLAAEASEEAILGALDQLTNRATKADTDLAALTNRATALTAERDTLLAAQVEADLAKYANRIRPEQKDVVKAALLKNRADALALLEAMPEPAAPAAAAKPLYNRAGPTPANAAAGGDERAAVDKAESEINTFRLANRCTYTQARDHVRATKPELFPAAA